jgi:shikimate dehydrogenase
MKEQPNFQQELTAVFGQPVWENPTQTMVEAAYRHHNLNFRYLTIDVSPEDLGTAIAGARAMGFRGLNFTIPHKVAAMEHLDEIAESARAIGAVNVAVLDGGRLVGHNTDGKGFLESVQDLRDPAGARVFIIGAGGAARAISVEFALAGAKTVTIVNRSQDRGSGLVQHLQNTTGAEASLAPWSDAIVVPPDSDVVVNATSIGLYPDPTSPPLNFDSLTPDMIVADVIHNPPKTLFLTRAAERGCRTVDGLGMLVNQGRIGIQHWTGVYPDAEPMRRSLEALFG